MATKKKSGNKKSNGGLSSRPKPVSRNTSRGRKFGNGGCKK